jgi:hypothetical protein
MNYVIMAHVLEIGLQFDNPNINLNEHKKHNKHETKYFKHKKEFKHTKKSEHYNKTPARMYHERKLRW